MAFRLKPRKPVSRGLARILADEFSTILGESEDRPGADSVMTVHDVRKHVKKIRAILRLFEKRLGSDYRVINGQLRAVAHELSPLRDAVATMDMMTTLRDRYPHVITLSVFRPAHRALRARSPRNGSEDGSSGLAPVARKLLRSRDAVPWRILRRVASREVRNSMEQGYRRARKAMAAVNAQPEDALFHAWRRRVKDHWYQMRLLARLSHQVRSRARRLKQLETALGRGHDLVVLRSLILEEPARFGGERAIALILGCIAKYQTTLRRRAVKQGRDLFAPKPSAFRKRCIEHVGWPRTPE
jgi:CHAD domain-containing protein